MHDCHCLDLLIAWPSGRFSHLGSPGVVTLSLREQIQCLHTRLAGIARCASRDVRTRLVRRERHSSRRRFDPDAPVRFAGADRSRNLAWQGRGDPALTFGKSAGQPAMTVGRVPVRRLVESGDGSLRPLEGRFVETRNAVHKAARSCHRTVKRRREPKLCKTFRKTHAVTSTMPFDFRTTWHDMGRGELRHEVSVQPPQPVAPSRASPPPGLWDFGVTQLTDLVSALLGSFKIDATDPGFDTSMSIDPADIGGSQCWRAAAQ